MVYTQWVRWLWVLVLTCALAHAETANTPISPFTLRSGETLVRGNLTLRMQAQGNLVLYRDWGKSSQYTLWANSTGNGCNADCTAVFQTDGNLVLYRGNGQPYWQTSSGGRGGVGLVLTDAMPSIAIVTANNSILWSGSTVFDNLVLNAGSFADVAGMRLLMQTDGNLVLYENNGPQPRALWSSATYGRSCQACVAIFQNDGNFVLYDRNAPFWSSSTGGEFRFTFSATRPYLSIGSAGAEPAWTSDLGAGGARFESTSSSSASAAIVSRGFREVLGRMPGTAGLAAFVPIVDRERLSLADFRNRLRVSQEYANLVGTTRIAPEIRLMYQQILGRVPDSSGGPAFTSMLYSVTDFNQVRAALASSAEAGIRINLVFDAAYEIVGIAASPSAEQVEWARQYLANGGNLVELRTLILARTKHYFSTQSIQRLDRDTNRLFLQTLDREAVLGDGSPYVMPQANAMRGAVVGGAEFGIAVDKVYRVILRRAATAAEKAQAAALVNAGQTLANVRSLAWNSAECVTNPVCGTYRFPTVNRAATMPWPTDHSSIFANPTPFKHSAQFENSVSYGTHPGLGDYMLGRKMNPGSNYWSMTLVRMDWATNQVKDIKTVLDTTTRPPITDGYRIVAAYDATLVPWAGEYWAAFECDAIDPSGKPVGVGACAGPLVGNRGDFRIDTSRTTFLVRAFSYVPEDRFMYSGSVPKIVSFGGKLYLYYTVVLMDMENSEHNDIFAIGHFVSVNGRGVQLELKNGLMRPFGFTSVISANDPATVEVLGNNSGLLKTAADLFQVIPYGDQLIATGAAGQNCPAPDAAHPENCYQMFFSVAADPLGYHVFNEGLKPITGIPKQQNQYYRFVYRPSDRRTTLLGGSFAYVTNKNFPADAHWTWPTDLWRPVCDSVNQPYPLFIERSGNCVRTGASPTIQTN